MVLHYLDFDFSDEDSGHGSFDAMATVQPDRLPAVRAEIDAILRWARQTFGEAGTPGDEGDWDFDLQALQEPGGRHTTLTFTLSGSPGFCEAFRSTFSAAG